MELLILTYLDGWYNVHEYQINYSAATSFDFLIFKATY